MNAPMTGRQSLHDLVTLAFHEMEEPAIRYGDREIAQALADLDAQGLLYGNARMCAARIIVEIAARLNDYSSAAGMLSAIRAHALITAAHQPRQESNE